jgi:hypothetical protein
MRYVKRRSLAYIKKRENWKSTVNGRNDEKQKYIKKEKRKTTESVYV